jgi:pimeloyl-ACP methyl ester carboxylesterase
LLDLRRDLEAAVQTARALGYRSVVLQGHSQGSLHVQFYAATTWDADVKAVILLGAFADLPWTAQRAHSRRGELQRADRGIDEGIARGDTRRGAAGKNALVHGQQVPITAQHFLTYRWDTGSIAGGTFWIRHISRPILLVRDQADAFILPFEPYALLSAAQGRARSCRASHTSCCRT